VAFIDHPTLTAFQMLEEIGRQIGLMELPSNKLRAINEIRKALARHNEAGHRTLVIVDEGQMLAHRPDLLQELRILLNLCLPDRFLLSLVFSGQRPLEGAVRSMPEFWQRLPVRYLLRNLDLAGTHELLRHRMRCAGLPADREIFTAGAVERIFRFSKGCPRVICSVADLALLIGSSQRVRTVDEQEVFEAARDMDAGSDGSYHYFQFVRQAQGTGLLQRPMEACAPHRQFGGANKEEQEASTPAEAVSTP
jgi:type II secretory pathway predicted ATPase ExeA